MNKIITRICTVAFMMALYILPSTAMAQVGDRIEVATVRDGYVMIDNEMLAINSGKMTKLNKNVKMENGTKIKKNGTVKVKGQKRVKMKNGHCIDKSGKIDDCNVGSQHYTCSHHKHVRASKNGKCPECGMDLEKRN